MAARATLQRMVALAAAVCVAAFLALVSAAAGPAEPQQSHDWKNVQIAGGGFVPGIVFSPAEKDLLYARTDIGGAYRWDKTTGRWTPLLDWVGWDRWGHNGVASIAPDPRDANKVYAAVGMYTNSRDPSNGAILRSADRGNTLQVAPLPFKVGGNMPGRGMGERLAVDPNDGRVLYFGAPSGKGLWRSTDGGATWARAWEFTNYPDRSFRYTMDVGSAPWLTWDANAAPPEVTPKLGWTVESLEIDPFDSNRMLYGTGATIHGSTDLLKWDAGATFTGGAFVAASKLHAVPGREGELWLAGEGGLFRSVDGGATVTRAAGVTSAVNIGFGKAAPGRTYPALYAVLSLGGATGVYRSDDVGANWVRINDDRHQYGNMGEAITGDPRVYGRVYLGTNGRGILYADPVGAPPSTSTTTSTTTSTSTSTTTGAPPVLSCAVEHRVPGQWSGGFTASVKIANRGASAVNGWQLRWSFANGQTITNAWNGEASQSGAAVTMTNEGWNGTIGAGGTVEFGFQASWQGSNVTPTGFTLNGGSCTAP